MISRDLQRTDLNLFLIFATIYQEQSITKAADALHVSQPAVSASVSRLREIFNDPLFVRSRNGVTPTNLACSLIGPIQEALNTLDVALRETKTFDPTTSQRTICVSMGDLAEVLFLDPLVTKIEDLRSSITVHNILTPENELHAKLASGEMDFAIEYFNIDAHNLKNQVLLRDEFVCVLRKDHPALCDEWDLDAYLSLNHLLISSRPRGEGVVDAVLANLGVRRHISIRIQHCLAAYRIVKNNNICLTVPRRFVAECLDENNFEIRPVPFSIPNLELCLYWHQSNETNLAHDWTKKLILDIASR